MRLFLHLISALTALAASTAPLAARPAAYRPAPRPVAATHAQPFAIAANPLAARAGLAVLKRGGSAVDAAVAMQAMLSL
ncbi:MAG: gamma-glutamyltransferase, partial [Sphingomicrobium sp.]